MNTKRQREKITFRATVVSGLGEAANFMSMSQYRKNIENVLGFSAYPGTLNLKISDKDKKMLIKGYPLRIKGFFSSGKDNESMIVEGSSHSLGMRSRDSCCFRATMSCQLCCCSVMVSATAIFRV